MGVYLTKNLKGESLPEVYKINVLLEIPGSERIQPAPTKLSSAPAGKTFICIFGYFEGENTPTKDSACVIDTENEFEQAIEEEVDGEEVAFISWIAMDTLTVNKLLGKN